jgi:hypothetical protein
VGNPLALRKCDEVLELNLALDERHPRTR